MNSLETILKARLQKAFNPSYLKVIDESEKHRGHAGYEAGGRHFAVIIAAQRFQQLNKVAAHRLIYEVLADLLQKELHALRIQIKSPI